MDAMANYQTELLAEDVQNLPKLTAIELQQQYFDNLMGCDWVKYERSNRKYLIQNIAFALFGNPSTEGELVEASEMADGAMEIETEIEEVVLKGYNSRQKEQVVRIYEKLCEQGKYSLNDMDIVMSVLLVVCCKPNPVGLFKFEPADYWWDLHKKTDIVMWCTAVFRVRKCIPSGDGDHTSCRMYIDENARVYLSWESYLQNNTLPKCVLVLPQNGEYKGDQQEDGALAVRVSVVASPALGASARILSAADTTSTVASLGALGVLGAAVFTPVGPVVLAGATVATVSTALYGLVRSSLHLHDRRMHEQTISPTDAEARGSWINIAASSVGVTAGAATSLLSRSAAAGTNMTRTGIILERSVDVLRHANLVTGGLGLANSLAHIALKYHKHGEPPTKLELFQFTASTLFFASAVMSNRTAKSIIEEAQTKTINQYRDTLRSNRHRKIFDKVSAETRRIEGAVVGNAEVIRSIRNIADKDQYFADVLRINKDVNANGMRISLTADGKVNLNARHTFNPSDLAGLPKESRVELFGKLGPADLTVWNAPTKLQTPTTVAAFTTEEDDCGPLVNIRPGEVLRIGSMLFRLTTYSAEQMADMLHSLSKDAHSALFTVAMNVLSRMCPRDIAKLRILNPDKDLIYQVVEFVFNYLKECRPLGECRDTDNGIVIVLKEFFQDGCIRQDTILNLTCKYSFHISRQISLRMQQFPHKREITCDVCKGTRYA